MDRGKQTWGWLTLGLVFGGTGLSLFGAFLGAERSALLFNSPPMFWLWLAIVAAMGAGLLRFRPLRRCPGLLGMHLGALLILLGSMANSDRGHRALQPAAARWSYLPLRPGQVASETRDRSLRRVVHELPFAVRLDAFEIDRYPAGDETPSIHAGTLARDPVTRRIEWRMTRLDAQAGRPEEVPGTPLRLVVRSMPAPGEGALVAGIELVRDGIRREARLVCDAGEPVGRLPLAEILPEAGELPPGASLFLVRPEAPVRQYRSRLAFLDGDRKQVGQAEVNRPVRFRGYHFYQYAWGAEPEPHTVLLVVSHFGMPLVYAGFLLLGFGTVWRFWIRPLFPVANRGAGPCT